MTNIKIKSKKLIALLLLAMLSISSTTIAQEIPKNERIEPTAFVVGENVCFTIDGGKEVAKIFADYHLLWSYSNSLEKENGILRKELVLANDTADGWKNLSIEFQERGDLYKKSFYESHKALLTLESRQAQKDKWAWVPWSLSAVVAVLSGIVMLVK